MSLACMYKHGYYDHGPVDTSICIVMTVLDVAKVQSCSGICMVQWRAHMQFLPESAHKSSDRYQAGRILYRHHRHTWWDLHHKCIVFICCHAIWNGRCDTIITTMIPESSMPLGMRMAHAKALPLTADSELCLSACNHAQCAMNIDGYRLLNACLWLCRTQVRYTLMKKTLPGGPNDIQLDKSAYFMMWIAWDFD